MVIAGGTNTVGSDGLIIGGNDTTGTVWLTGGQLIVTNGDTLIGYTGVGSLTQSNGTLQAQNVYVGSVDGSEGTLTAVGGASSIYSNLTLGDCAADAFGLLFVRGGDVFVTNATHNAVLDVRNGWVLLTGGAVDGG